MNRISLISDYDEIIKNNDNIRQPSRQLSEEPQTDYNHQVFKNGNTPFESSHSHDQLISQRNEMNHIVNIERVVESPIVEEFFEATEVEERVESVPQSQRRGLSPSSFFPDQNSSQN